MKLLKYSLAVAALVLFSATFAGKKKKPTTKGSNTFVLKDVKDSLGYAIGLDIGASLKAQGFDTIISIAAIHNAIDQTLDTSATTLIDHNEARAFLQAYFTKLQEEKNKAQFGAKIEEQEKFLAENKKKEGVIETASGLQYTIIKEGKGPKPSINDQVTVHYHGMLLDGTVFDSSVDRGNPATFPVGGVIPGWVEALQLMPQGSKWKLFVPYQLAYGARGAGGSIGPYSLLVFEVELLDIKKQ